MSNDRFKFRVWDSALEHYRTDFYIGVDGVMFYLHDDIGELERVVGSRWIIEQCTGIKDKNGNFIFEGDLVYSLATRENYEVKWVPDKTCFAGWNDGWFWEAISNDACEVVGNIHEEVE